MTADYLTKNKNTIGSIVKDASTSSWSSDEDSLALSNKKVPTKPSPLKQIDEEKLNDTIQSYQSKNKILNEVNK